MKQVLDEEDVREPRRCSDCVPHAWADEPWGVQVHNHEDKDVNGPDTQSTARMKVVEVFWLVARRKKDRRDEESGKAEEENNSGPSPQRRIVDPRADEPRIAVIDNDPKNGKPAQPVEFGQVCGQP